MKLKKMLSLLVAISMLCSVGITAMAEETAVAKIGDTTYATLQAAFDAAVDGDTITVLTDITFTNETVGYTDGIYTDGVRYTGGKSFTVDFGGHTVTDNGCVNDYLLYINNTASNDGSGGNVVTFKNGTVISKNGCWSAICANGDSSTMPLVLNLKDMTIENSNAAYYSGNLSVRSREMATVNVNEGTTITSNGASYGVAAATINSKVNINSGATIIQKNSGTSSGNSTFAAVGCLGVVNIYDGAVINSDLYGVHTMTSANPVVNIYGGTITAKTALKASTNGAFYQSATINVYGGTISGALDEYTDNANVVVSGGTFDTDVSSYVTEGSTVTIKGTTYTMTSGELTAVAVAKIGDNTYTTLQAAIDAAADGTEIDIITDIVLTAQNANPSMKVVYNRESYAGIIIPDDKVVTIDLNGKTISYIDEYTDCDNVMVLNLGNLTINDSVGGGKLTYKPVAGERTYTYFYSTVFNCGTLTVNGGTIENTCETITDVSNAIDNHSRLSHEYNNDCILTVNGGTLIGAEYRAIRQYTHYYAGVKNRVTINDGIVMGGIYMQHGDSWYYTEGANNNRANVDCYLTINGGTITTVKSSDGSDYGHIRMYLSNPDNKAFGIEINDGTIEVPVQIRVQKGYRYSEDGTATSGTMLSGEAAGARTAEWLETNGGFITGGTFTDIGNSDDVTSDVSAYLADGYTLSENTDGTYGVKASPVAKIGDNTYPTLQQAFDAAVDSDTITVLTDITIDESTRYSLNGYYEGVYYEGDKSFTIDLGGHKLTNDSSVNDYLMLFKNAGSKANEITIKNGTVEAAASAYCAICTSAGSTKQITVNLEDVNVIGNNSSGAVVKVRGGTLLNVNDGTTITGNNSYAGIEIVGTNTVANINDGVEIYQKGTTSTLGALAGVSYGATLNVNGGSGESALCGFIAMTSGGTINAKGGEWTALSTSESQGVISAQNNKSAYSSGVDSVINVSGGVFDGYVSAWTLGNADEVAKVNITGGTFSVDPTVYIADSEYIALPDLDGNYVVGEKPTATVNDLGATVIPAGEYGVWNGSSYTSTSTEDMPLSFVMQFLADQTETDMETSPYADWYADFVITFDGLEGGSFVADGCYLAGYYGDFGWVKVPVDGMTITQGTRYPVMLGVGLGQKYDYVCSGVKDFQCALYLTPAILEANPDIKVNLELAVVDNSKGSDAAATAIVNNTNVYKVTDYDYTAEDFVVEELFDFSGTTVTLGNSMQISFFAKQEYFDGEDYYAVVEHCLPDGEIAKKEYKFAEWEARTLSGVDYYAINYSNLAAKQIADEIYVTIYKTDGTQISTTKADGLSAYAYRTLANTTNGELRTALVDMLNYGAAAQTYFEYNTENLANANAETYQQYATTDVSHLKDERVSDDNFVGTTVTLENNIQLTGYFKNLTSDMYAVASFTDHYGKEKTLEVSGEKFVKYNDTTYGVCVDNLVVADAAQLVTITVYNADGSVYSTLKDSINGYLKRSIDKGEIYTAIAKFTTSAYNYLH